MKVYCAFFLLIAVQVVVGYEHVTSDDLKRFADANNYLGARLYHRIITGHSGNVLFCPASLMTGLGMMMYGARGKTHEELYSVLGYKATGLDNEKVPSTYNYYFKHMLPENDPNTINYTLSCADEVLIKNEIKLYPSYVKEVQGMYQRIRNVDFSSDAVKVAHEINSFVRERTHGKVETFLESVRPDMTSYLVDAVYFRGNWGTPFSAGPYQPFYNMGADAKNLQYMQVTSMFDYAETDQFQVISLPYIGDHISFMVLLPKQRDGLSAIERSMTPLKVREIIDKMHRTKVFVTLPKFRLEYSRDFSNDFAALGAKSIFTGPADFSGMTASTDLFVSGAMHKAVFDVNYDGHQFSTPRPEDFHHSPTTTFNADHPFMFAVMDKRNGMFVFFGRVYNL